MRGLLDKFYRNIENSSYNKKEKICEKIYKKIFDNLKSELALKIEALAKIDLFDKQTSNDSEDYNFVGRRSTDSNDKNNQNLPKVLKPSQYNVIRNTYVQSLNPKDREFGTKFSQTQIFINYFEDIRMKKLI